MFNKLDFRIVEVLESEFQSQSHTDEFRNQKLASQLRIGANEIDLWFVTRNLEERRFLFFVDNRQISQCDWHNNYGLAESFKPEPRSSLFKFLDSIDQPDYREVAKYARSHHIPPGNLQLLVGSEREKEKPKFDQFYMSEIRRLSEFQKRGLLEYIGKPDCDKYGFLVTGLKIPLVLVQHIFNNETHDIQKELLIMTHAQSMVPKTDDSITRLTNRTSMNPIRRSEEPNEVQPQTEITSSTEQNNIASRKRRKNLNSNEKSVTQSLARRPPKSKKILPSPMQIIRNLMESGSTPVSISMSPSSTSNQETDAPVLKEPKIETQDEVETMVETNYQEASYDEPATIASSNHDNAVGTETKVQNLLSERSDETSGQLPDNQQDLRIGSVMDVQAETRKSDDKMFYVRWDAEEVLLWTSTFVKEQKHSDYLTEKKFNGFSLNRIVHSEKDWMHLEMDYNLYSMIHYHVINMETNSLA